MRVGTRVNHRRSRKKKRKKVLMESVDKIDKESEVLGLTAENYRL